MHHTMHKSVIICIKMILQWSLFSRLTACSPYLGKQTKAILAWGWFVRMSGGGREREMVDAFIKYGNLLNGLWQSHWRSLFRCRWLPPYWLPLSLEELPVRGKREESSLQFPQTDSQSPSLSVCMSACLALPLSPLRLTLFPPSLCINSPLMQQRGEQAVSQLDRSACMKARSRARSRLSWREREMGSWLREQV